MSKLDTERCLYMITPNTWIEVSDPEELLALSKKLKLTPKTFTEPKPLIYNGFFVDSPASCKLVGYKTILSL